MKYKNLNISTWKELDQNGSRVSGYKSIWLALNENERSTIHIFVDHLSHYHLAMETNESFTSDINDVGVNGLKVEINSYRFNQNEPKSFIDISCSLVGYLNEFNEIVKQIAESILENNEEPIDAIYRIVENWKSFWAIRRKEILSQEMQIGLICEILVLRKLAQIHPLNALKSWTGPLGEKYDFVFTDWVFEVKGTRNSNRVHTVNGIDQLQQPENKDLAFISFLVTTLDTVNSYNLPDLIAILNNTIFSSNPSLSIRFNELLAAVGYSPIHDDEYREFNISILDSTLYHVEDDFPRITTDKLNDPLGPRISNIKYDINLEGFDGDQFQGVNLGSFFY